MVPGAWSIWQVRHNVSDLIYRADGLLDQGHDFRAQMGTARYLIWFRTKSVT
jgi:hypothetical protein